ADLGEGGIAVEVVSGVAQADVAQAVGQVVQRGRLVVAAEVAVLGGEPAEVLLVVLVVAPVLGDGQAAGVPAPLVLNLLLHVYLEGHAPAGLFGVPGRAG